LLVDDDHQIVRMMKKALETDGFEVLTVTSGKAALDAVRRRPPDLLVLDLNIPEPDGFDVLKIERSQFPYLRILVISGLNGALLEAAKLVGAIATMQKPFEPGMLVTKVRELLGS
jgi:DNA-binding response OmpR family regulator